MRLWDLATQETRLTLKPGMPMAAVAFSPDGQTLATGGLFENIQLWDVATGRSLLTLQAHDRQGTGPWCWSVAFSPDGKTLAGASQTGLVRIWDTTTARLVASLKGHTANVKCLAFSPDGSTLASGTRRSDRPTLGCRHRTGKNHFQCPHRCSPARATRPRSRLFPRRGHVGDREREWGHQTLADVPRAGGDRAETEFDPDEPESVAELLGVKVKPK